MDALEEALPFSNNEVEVGRRIDASVHHLAEEPQPSSGKKRKRSRPVSAPEVEEVNPNQNIENEQTDLTGRGEAPEIEDEHGEGCVEHEDMDDDWLNDDVGGGSCEAEDMDEDSRADCVEGQINPGMIDSFLHGEENRTFRSKVWREFSKIRMGGVVTKGECIHCKVQISAKRGAGNSAMITHLKRCKIRKSVTNVSRRLRSVVMSPEGVALDNWRFSQDVSRKELSRIISLHSLPLAIVDFEGFWRFVSSLNPIFKMNSRGTITTDCLVAFHEQKQALQDILKGNNNRVSLTMDMWTSNQTIGYMCITCHFLNDDWKMIKRIIKFSFFKIPHTGVATFNEVLKSIQDWNIEDKLFAITLDNANNNNSMVKLLRKNLLEKQMLCGKGKVFHHRCAAHVLNLICKAGFEIINPIVYKVREGVKYIEGSTSRKQKFEEIIQQLGISFQKRPNIDTPTRWNSTYLMLETCLELRRAFDSLGQQDPEYTYSPSTQEWEKARKVCGLLKAFYDATMVISGTFYPTSNLYFHEIWEVKVALESEVPDADLLETVQYMKKKFQRYWKLTWMQISFPVIFDPRFKFAFIEFRLKQAFGSEAESKIDALKKVLLELFKDYSEVNLGNMTQHVARGEQETNASDRYADWDHHMSHNASSISTVPSELETYLAKYPIPRTVNFDILAWWKSNTIEFPTISRIARDVLAVQASTVAFESAFSLGRRLISDFRSHLTPQTVEALICLQDWIRAAGSLKFSMEGIENCIELPDQDD